MARADQIPADPTAGVSPPGVDQHRFWRLVKALASSISAVGLSEARNRLVYTVWETDIRTRKTERGA